MDHLFEEISNLLIAFACYTAFFSDDDYQETFKTLTLLINQMIALKIPLLSKQRSNLKRLDVMISW